MPLKILIETYISWVEQSYINENCKIKILSSFFLRFTVGICGGITWYNPPPVPLTVKHDSQQPRAIQLSLLYDATLVAMTFPYKYVQNI